MKLQQENIPDGYHEIKNVTGVYRKDGHIVVCGVPDFDDETHNCDHMGCSSVSHVLFRCCCGQLPEVGYKEPVIVEEQIYDAMMKHNGRIAFRIDVALEIANQLPEGKTRDLLAQEIRISERRSNEFKHSSNV